jgi:redox-sensitive bicupin YhaK (pirin superfamily)
MLISSLASFNQRSSVARYGATRPTAARRRTVGERGLAVGATRLALEEESMSIRTPIEREIARVITTDPPAPGFAGAGHEAVFVVEPSRFAEQDPFILLADDRLDMSPGATVGGEHPHAGFEIATYVLEGVLDEGEEGVLHQGDVLWTTAGRGIIHNERAMPKGPTRILQLWFALPEVDRWVEPHYEVIRRDDAPVRREPGVEVRVYGGSSGNARVQRRTHVPITLAELRMDAGAELDQELPATYNGFLYVLEGTLQVGDIVLAAGQVGWLDRPDADGESRLHLAAGEAGAHAVLYAGEPQHRPIVTHGPFVGGSRADLMRMSRDFMSGKFQRMSELARAARAR